jgi:hypothetical protein
MFERMENEMTWFECILPHIAVCHGNEISSDAINSALQLGEHKKKKCSGIFGRSYGNGILFYSFVFDIRTEERIYCHITCLGRRKFKPRGIPVYSCQICILQIQLIWSLQYTDNVTPQPGNKFHRKVSNLLPMHENKFVNFCNDFCNILFYWILCRD